MRLVTREAWRTAVVVAILGAIAMLLTTRGRIPLPANPDGVVAATQISRAETMPSAELLVLGDSSAMTGVDVDVSRVGHHRLGGEERDLEPQSDVEIAGGLSRIVIERGR